MFSTKIRTTFATLATAFTVALATGPSVPVAQAAPNDHRYQDSGEAQRQQFCKLLESTYNASVANFAKAAMSGNVRTAAEIQKSIDGLQTLGEGNGCGWAS
jgi:hypothetical protein